MNSQHLSDEAVAAFADGVLGGHARERAARHTEGCAECRQAVVAQREAAWALRAAPAPALPLGLADRLRDLPRTTPVSTLPTAVGPDGSTVLTTSPSADTPADRLTHSMQAHLPATMAALVAPTRPRRAAPFVATAAAFALAGGVVAGVVTTQDGTDEHPVTHPAAHQVAHRNGTVPGGDGPLVAPVSLLRGTQP